MGAYEQMFGEETQTKPKDNLVAPTKSKNFGKNLNLQPEEEQDDLDKLMLGSIERNKQKTTQTTPQIGQQVSLPTQQKQSGGLVADTLKNLFEAKQQAPAFAASALDVIAGAPSMIAGTVGYGAGRLFGLSPEEATRASQKVAGQLAAPVGRATGLAETKQYQQALPTQVMEYIGKNINEGAESIAQKFGLPVADVQNAINAAMIVAPIGAKPIAKGLAEAKAALPTVRVETVKPTGLQSGGAAASTKKAMLDEAMAEIKDPELKAQLAKENPANIDVHVRTTALEILADFPDGLDAIITGVGTGGHLTGVAQVLKAKWPKLKVFAVEPTASPVISGGAPAPHPIQGIGAGFIPKICTQTYLMA